MASLAEVVLSKALETSLSEIYTCLDQRLKNFKGRLLAVDLQSTGINFAVY